MAARKSGVTATELAEKLGVTKNYGQAILAKAREGDLIEELDTKRIPPLGRGRPASAFVLRA
jgi:predicted ArsR family transcriptional regulator